MDVPGHWGNTIVQTLSDDRPNVPVIALTAHAIKEDMDKSIEAGCTAHLTKPIKKQTLLAALEDYLTA